MRLDRPLLLLLAALTAGCADPEPFVDPGLETYREIGKPRDPVLVSGRATICFSDQTPWDEVRKLAEERCGAHGLQVHSYTVTRWQCRATSPHQATFRCFDPEMLDANGNPVNVFSEQDVARWEKRTGKKAKPHNSLGIPQQPEPSLTTPPVEPPAPTAPPRAPVSSAAPAATMAPITPADIASKPAIPPTPARPVVSTPPAAGGAYPADGFTLPQGSWGDHFQD